MAKVSFSKLGLTKNTNVNIIEYNGQNVEVKQYLPINEKAILISNVLNYTISNGLMRFINPVQLEVFTVLQIVEKYTNINFTEKQKEDPVKLYDLIVSSDFWNKILDNLNKEEYNIILNYIDKSINSFYNYYNSVYGILDNMNKEYETLNLDATEIQKKLSDPEHLSLLKDVVTKLG